MLDINTINFSKQNGLVPAIIQDRTTLRVLMLGYITMKPSAKH
jgi:phosphoribosyl-AMP cyclohydrolase